MNGAGGTITALVGLLTLRLTLSGSFQRYVQSGMRPWLLLAGVVVLVVGLTTLVRSLLAKPDTHDEHDHHGVGVGWLLLVPVAALLLVAPPALGSFGVDRAIKITASSHDEFKPVSTTDGPVPMTLLEYAQRSFDHDGRSMHGATVRLTGFVADGSTATSFRLARYQISCCAADAAAAVVRVEGIAGAPPPRDQWVVVTGSYHAVDGEVPVLTATGVEQISPPEDPYE